MATIDPAVLAGLGDLALAARTVVDGVMFGVHPSRILGAGMEFSQFRSYQPGDDLRRVDWKLYARSDRYFVREAETETSVTVRVLLDASASMAHRENGLAKFDYAKLVAAAIAYLANRQGDAVGLYAVNDTALTRVGPERGQQHIRRVLHTLERLEPKGVWPAWPALERAIADGAHRGITVIVSDLHQQEDEILTAVLKTAALRQETLLLHILGRGELEWTFTGTVTLEDLETGRQLTVDADRAAERYRQAMERELQRVRRAAEDRQVRYGLLPMDQPVDQALRQFLSAHDRLY